MQKLSQTFDSLNFIKPKSTKAPSKSKDKKIVQHIVLPNRSGESIDIVNNFEDFESDSVKLSSLGESQSEKSLTNLGEYFSIEY